MLGQLSNMTVLPCTVFLTETIIIKYISYIKDKVLSIMPKDNSL